MLALNRQSIPWLGAAGFAALILFSAWFTSDSDCSAIRAPSETKASAFDGPGLSSTVSADSAASAESSERHDESVEAAWLEFVDSLSQASLEPDELLVEACSDSAGNAFVDLRRGGVVEPGADYEIRVHVPGYVALAGRIQPLRGENRVLLERAGSVAVQVVDSDGRPMEGVDLELLPPLAEPQSGLSLPPEGLLALVHTSGGWVRSTELHLLDNGLLAPPACAFLVGAPTRRTGESGRALWVDVPALAGYRWFVKPPPHVRTDPPHESKRFTEVEGALRVKELPPEGLSGRFEVHPGTTVQWKATLTEGASVKGRIACGTASSPATVTLYKVSIGGGLTATRGVAFDSMDRRTTDSEGSFEFVDIEPGTWLVRAWWLEGDHDYHFTSATFVLDSGSDLDLGLLLPLQGSALAVTLSIEDVQGQALDPAKVFPQAPKPPRAGFTITASPSDEDAIHMVSGVFLWPIGETFIIHGLQPGTVYATAQPPPGLRADSTWIGKLSAAAPASFAVGSQGSLDLSLVATVGIGRALRVVTSTGEEVPAPALWVRDLTSDTMSWVSTVQSPLDGTQSLQQLNLPPGAYDLWFKLSSGTEAPGLVGSTRATFEAGDTNPVELVVEPAATLSCVLRDALGRPIADRNLSWTCAGWPLGGGSGSLYTARTNEEGAFRVSDIPVGMRLTSEEPGLDLLAGQTGLTSGLELTLSH